MHSSNHKLNDLKKHGAPKDPARTSTEPRRTPRGRARSPEGPRAKNHRAPKDPAHTEPRRTPRGRARSRDGPRAAGMLDAIWGGNLLSIQNNSSGTPKSCISKSQRLTSGMLNGLCRQGKLYWQIVEKHKENHSFIKLTSGRIAGCNFKYYFLSLQNTSSGTPKSCISKGQRLTSGRGVGSGAGAC